jgi:hypothetical protein
MAGCLSALTKLESLRLGFQSPRSHHPSPPSTSTRADGTVVLLPALTHFWFQGVCGYLEDLVTAIDAPLLGFVQITFFSQPSFSISQLAQFIGRTRNFNALSQADVVFLSHSVEVTLSPHPATGKLAVIMLGISRAPPGEAEAKAEASVELSSALELVCSSVLPRLSPMERLDIREDRLGRPRWQANIANAQWLELLRPFTAVKILHLSGGVALHIAPALQGLSGESAAQVVPALRSLFVVGLQQSGAVQEAVFQFIAARQVAGCPIVVPCWERRQRVVIAPGDRRLISPLRLPSN